MSLFKKAEKSRAKLRLALTGPSGSGKTYSALLIARGLVGPKGRIALIDTENATANLYAGREHIGEFDIAEMNPPYEVRKYTTAIEEAVKAGFDCVIIDSLSHAWAGEGGILQRKEALDSRGGNSFTNWAKMTPEHNALVNAVLHSKTHLIATMRTKTEYVVENNDKGKAAPKKVGTAPIQRDGFEYEFDITFEVALDHTAVAGKDRSSLFDQRIFKPTNATGQELRAWLESGAAEKPAPAVEAPKDEFRAAEEKWKKDLEAKKDVPSASSPSGAAPSKETPKSAATAGRGPESTKAEAPVRADVAAENSRAATSLHDVPQAPVKKVWIIGFGKKKGKNIYDLPRAELEEYAFSVHETVNDPEKAAKLSEALLEQAKQFLAVAEPIIDEGVENAAHS